MLRLALTDWLEKERSITVAEAAVVLGADESTVRALVRSEVLEGHRVGKTDENPGGVRVNLQSALDYKARHTIRNTDGRTKPAAGRRRRREATASYREAMVALRAMGSKV